MNKKNFLLLFIISLVITCSGKGDDTISGGRLRLNFGSSQSKLLAPQGDMDVVSYTVNGTGPNSAGFTENTEQSNFEIEDLSFGSWTVEVLGKNNAGVIIASGTGTTVVNTNEISILNIVIRPIEGEGNLYFTVEWYAAHIINKPEIIEAKLISFNNITTNLNGYTIENDQPEPGKNRGVFTVNNIETGYYTVTVKLFDGTELVMGAAEVVRIVDGFTTSGEFFFDEINFGSGFMTSWEKTFGTANTDSANSICKTSDEGYIITGRTASETNGDDILVLKINKDGELQWERTFGGSGNDRGYSVIESSQGGYFIAGKTNSSGAGNYDLQIIKLDFNGDAAWTKTYGGPGNDGAYSIIQSSDNNFIIAGSRYIDSNKGIDQWIMKINADGDILWERNFGSTGSDYFSSVDEAGDGGFIMLGSEYISASKGNNYSLVKINHAGNRVWTRTYGGTGDDRGLSVQNTPGEGFILAGRTNSYGAGSYDYWIIKTDSNGNIQWDKTFGGKEDDSPFSIKQTEDGGYITAGYTDSSGMGGDDCWILKLSFSGDKEWGKTYGGEYNDYGNSILLTDGGYIVAGSAESFGDLDGDMWILKVNEFGGMQ